MLCYRKQRAVDENKAAVGSQNSEFPFYEQLLMSGHSCYPLYYLPGEPHIKVEV